MTNITELSAITLSQKIKSGELKVRKCVEAFILQIEQTQARTAAVVKLFAESALQKAEELQRRVDKHEPLSLLAGVPFAVCSNIAAKGAELNAGSQLLGGFKADYDSTIVERMEQAGAILLAQLNMEEFGFFNISAKPLMRNPWAGGRTAGSTGCGSAVVTGAVPLAIGADFGGSMLASALCGASAFMAGNGTASLHGVLSTVPFGDRVTIAAKDARDISVAFQIIQGPDGKDSRCCRRNAFNNKYEASGFKIGVPAELTRSIPQEVRPMVLSVPEGLRQMGASVEVFSFSMLRHCAEALTAISCTELYTNTSALNGRMHTSLNTGGKSPDEIRAERLTPADKIRILVGMGLLENRDEAGADVYSRALNFVDILKGELGKLFAKYNLIILPASPNTAPENEQWYDPLVVASEQLAMLAPAVLSGSASAVVPCGYTPDGLPVGCQMIAPSTEGEAVLSAAAIFQSISKYHTFLAGE
ncbi:MAG: amidase [Oscillospiraceae bacterium]|nr:amidase [Oscillospiraceae bacterium]